MLEAGRGHAGDHHAVDRHGREGHGHVERADATIHLAEQAVDCRRPAIERRDRVEGIAVRLAGDPIVKPVLARVNAGGKRRPGRRSHGRHGAAQPPIRSLAHDAAEGRQIALGGPRPDQVEGCAVQADDEDFVFSFSHSVSCLTKRYPSSRSGRSPTVPQPHPRLAEPSPD